MGDPQVQYKVMVHSCWMIRGYPPIIFWKPPYIDILTMIDMGSFE